eukprot:TRINITY_DN550_c1_g1_i1.p1 TRINITY_DN550_c1_g1~~TRINITY_DN550_c1_g1_i1.p1  ORF type:complete len:562 (-),score=100.24 TRINITY_DN550_c1_g1_i1:1355-3040(-)
MLSERREAGSTRVYLQILALVVFASVSIFFIESQFSDKFRTFTRNQRPDMLHRVLREEISGRSVYRPDNHEVGEDQKPDRDVPIIRNDIDQKEDEREHKPNEAKREEQVESVAQQPKKTISEILTTGIERPAISASHIALIKEKKKYYEENPPPKVEKNDCVHTIHRDYSKNPVEFAALETKSIECDVPCARGSKEIGGSGCTHARGYERTMENTGRYIGDQHTIAGNTHRDSDVHIQYYSWAEYEFMRPPRKKTAKAAMVALISNCGPQYRLQYMRRLMAAGVSVHSYGACDNNMGQEQDHYSGARINAKQDGIIPDYKFTMSFENSETPDYVTEKLFGPLVAGSVPIYHGAPNGKIYAPTNRSIIFANDYKSPEEMAVHLKQLDSNDTLYQEYLQWKIDGPSKDFIALVDSSIVHSSCRFCIRSADLDRLVIGEVVTGPYIDENNQEMEKFKDKDALMLKVRERGTFYLRRIHVEALTIAEINHKIHQKWSMSKGHVYGFYRIWDRDRKILTTDKEVEELAYGDELEIIFEDPANPNRGSYSTWYAEKHKNKDEHHHHK